MRIPARGTPFFWILAASAAGHLGLFALIQGTLIFPAKPGSNSILSAAFAPESDQPVVESSTQEEVYYRIPVPTTGTGTGTGAPAEPPPRSLPSPLVSQSQAASSMSVPPPNQEKPLPPAWNRSLEPGSGPAPVFFEKPFTGKSVVFVIDVSGSMLEKSGKTTRLREAFSGVMQALGGLDPGQRFNVLLFADRVDAFRPAPVAADRATVVAAFRYLESDVNCGGSTNLLEALRRAMAMEPDSILLLSDGEANSEDAAILAEVRYLRGKLAKRVRIDTVGFYLKAGSRPELLLKQISRENGGDYAAWDPRLQTLPAR